MIWRLCLLLFIPWNICSQNTGDYIWQLGNESNKFDAYPMSMELRFTDDHRAVDTIYRPMTMGYFNTSLTSSNGMLLLYSNGCEIQDGNYNFISGSKDLNPGLLNDDWCKFNRLFYPTIEGGLFLPFKNDSLVLLLHQRQVVESPPLINYVNELYYTSLVKDENSYKIIEKSVPIVIDSLSIGRLEAVQGVAPDYWWVIQGVRNLNQYYTIGIENGIIDTIFLQSFGDTYIDNFESVGQSVFSPDANFYARFSPPHDLYLYEFNNQNGLLTNLTTLHVADSNAYGGLAFSSNSQFLYACTNFDLYQFDMHDADIQASKLLVGHFDGYADPFPNAFLFMQLGPDCKIYMNSINSSNSLHVIEQPNLKGVACDFKQHSLNLPAPNSITIPNFPVFRVNYPQHCDESIGTSAVYLSALNSFNIYPNPVEDEIVIQINSYEDNLMQTFVSLSTMLGQNLYSRIDISTELTYSFDVISLPQGTYILSIQRGKEIINKIIIKI